MHKYNAQWDQTENYDSYVSGCDSRISKSTTITAPIIKYWINVQLGLIVQRNIGIQGSAALGQVYIIFDSDDVNGYPVGINIPVADMKRYIKTNSSGKFSYSESNATIAGWILDYKKNQNDISSDYSLISGTVNAYDDNMTTSVWETVEGYGNNILEVGFSSRSVHQVHTYSALNIDAAGGAVTSRVQLKIAGAWTSVKVQFHDTTSTVYYSLHKSGTWNDVTGLRYIADVEAGYIANVWIYDVSVFE